MSLIRQQERIKIKIKRIKAALAADKRRWGGFYDDSRGLRYLPPELYIQLGDFSGGLKYLNWFEKNFPDDCGTPEFLFEWTIILFKSGKLKEAGKKAFETFCSNMYLLDKYFNREIKKIDKWEDSNIAAAEYVMDYSKYSYGMKELSDFSDWLRQFTATEKFIDLSNKFIEIQKRLYTETNTDIRRYLGKQADQLINIL